MALLTKGFASLISKNLHFKRHRHEYPWPDANNYEQCADVFLTKSATPSMHIHPRGDGDVVRYDEISGEFGILQADRHIRTYFLRPVSTIQEAAAGLAYFHRGKE